MVPDFDVVSHTITTWDLYYSLTKRFTNVDEGKGGPYIFLRVLKYTRGCKNGSLKIEKQQ